MTTVALFILVTKYISSKGKKKVLQIISTNITRRKKKAPVEINENCEIMVTQS